MKRLSRALLIVLTAAIVLAGCPLSYIFTANALKNMVLTYLVGIYPGGETVIDGHSQTTMTFDGTGAAGTMDVQFFTYDFGSQTAVDSGRYTDKTWFQNDGYQGTFTYDADARLLTCTATRVYRNNPTATQMTNGEYAAADYSYQDVIVDFPGATSASIVSSMNTLITQDYFYLVYNQGSASSAWVNRQSTTESATISGVTQTETYEATRTLTVQDGTFVRDTLYVDSFNDGTTTDTETDHYIYTNSISGSFLVGEADKEGQTFADVWKKGKKVTFIVFRTQYDEISFAGATAPAAPTVDPTSGEGTTGTRWTMPWYYISRDWETDDVTLTNAGDYIMYTYTEAFAARHLSPR